MLNLAQLWYQKGNQFLKAKQYEASIRCYDEVLKINSCYEKVKEHKLLACKARAQELFESGEYFLALKYCEDALQIQPDDNECLIQQRYILLHLEKEKTTFIGASLQSDLETPAMSLSSKIQAQETNEIKKISKAMLARFRNVSFPSTPQAAPTVPPELVGELAALSRDVYFVDPTYDPGDTKIREPLPPGWFLFDSVYDGSAILGTDIKNGYAGAIYIKDGINLLKPAYFVIAHKGTTFKTLSDLETDFEIFIGGKTGIFFFNAKTGSFGKFFKYALEKIRAKYGETVSVKQFISTGHSLGATLAQFCSDDESTVITFENPGFKSLYQSILTQGGVTEKEMLWYFSNMAKRSTNYLAHVNAINTCEPQLGAAFELINLAYNYSILNKQLQLITSHWWLNPNYAYYTILDQHDMYNISIYLNNHGVVAPANYPAGLNNGYIAYLDPSRVTYWKGYAEEIWHRQEDVREKYKQDFNKYYSDFIANLNKIWKEAQSAAALEKASIFPMHWRDAQPAVSELALAQASTELGVFKQANKYHKATVEITSGVVDTYKPQGLFHQ